MEIKVRLATTREELDHAREIRKKVFIMEQNVPEDVEIDQYEDTSNHIIALIDDRIIGTARWRKTENGIKLERFAVLSEYRSYGVGTAMTKFILNQLDHSKLIYLNAQESAISFYEKLGFNSMGPRFDEVGIPHQKMIFPKVSK